MKPKNVMLLGFVNRAVEYLDKHIDDENPNDRLTELKNIDLQTIKSQLSENLEFSLGSMQSTMTTLLHAGNDAFDKFIASHTNKKEAVVELDKVFDSYYDDDETSLTNSQDQLAKLLSFYNLDDVFEDDDVDLPEQREIKTIENINEDDEYLKQIMENASRKPEEELPPIGIAKTDTKQMDEIFSEIMQDDGTEEQTSENETINHSTKQEINVAANTNENDNTTENVEVDTNEVTNENANSSVSEKEVENTIVSSDETSSINENEDNNSDTNENEVEYKPYVSSLIDELKAKMIAEDEAKAKKEKENKEIYDKISKNFPNLSISFVKSAYAIKDDLNKEMPEGEKAYVLHRCVFKSVDELRQFVEIVLEHGYQINADESKLIVDSIKEVNNNSGRILTNIFEVANQANMLNASYDGYRIL